MKDFAKKYLELLTGEFQGINLTRIEDFDSFYNKQILDSVEPLRLSRVFNDSLQSASSVIDVGFGGGFPILPLAYKLPQAKFYGFEARSKKASVVTSIAERLNIKNATLIHQRIEDVLIDEEVAITLKAVGKIDEFLSYISTDKRIKVFFYKGPNYKELENLKKVLAQWDLIEEIEYKVDGTEGRVLLGFENKNVPHGTNKKTKIKFSSLHKL
jgi:16S rRNA (guanine527-N7)-methyltransferase